MKLRKKTQIIIGVALAGLIAVLYVSSQVILMGSFIELEEQNVHHNAERVQLALFNELDELDHLAYDQATWNMTYDYILEGNNSHFDSIYSSESLLEKRVNFMLFLNSSDGLVYGKAVDHQKKEDIPVPEDLLEQLLTDRLLVSLPYVKSRVNGIVILPQGPVLVASRPILNCEGNGPIRGTLIVGRNLDNEEIERLALITHISLKVFAFNDPYMPPDFQMARSSLLGVESIIVHPLDDRSFAGYIHMKDIYGKPGIVVQVSPPNEFYVQGRTSMNYYLLSALAGCILFGLLTHLLLERSVLSRLAHFSANVSAIGLRGDISGRLAMTGNDELSSLGGEIDRMLDALAQSQHELRKSEIKNRAILDAIPDLILQLKKDGTIFHYKAANDEYQFERFKKPLGKKIYEIMPEEIAQQIMHHIEVALKTKETQIFQYQLQKNGILLDYEVRVVVSEEDKVLAIISEITERKQIEEARKKEVLIKEIYHRVKNNLQVISSLLYLQSKNFKDPKVIEVFTESQNRVKSMAFAHEKLYQSKDLANIDFADYIKKLTNYLFQSFGIDFGDVQLKLDIAEIYLGIDTAIPCGLIVNELVTNSLKHAFPAGKKGEICISFHPDDKKYTLIIRDDGVGFPEIIDYKKTESFGLQLVMTLVEQIDAQIELNRNNGTEFKITFKELIYKERG